MKDQEIIAIFQQHLDKSDLVFAQDFGDIEDKNLKSFHDRKSYRDWWCSPPRKEPYRDEKFYVRELTRACMIAEPKRIVEIGTALGMGLVVLKILCPDAWIFSIDLGQTTLAADGKEYMVGHIAKECGVQYQQIIGDSEYQWFEAIDMVFIDGDHSNEAVMTDSKNAEEWGAKTIVWHDYSDCKEAVDTFCGFRNWKLRRYPDSDTVFATKS